MATGFQDDPNVTGVKLLSSVCSVGFSNNTRTPLAAYELSPGMIVYSILVFDAEHYISRRYRTLRDRRFSRQSLTNRVFCEKKASSQALCQYCIFFAQYNMPHPLTASIFDMLIKCASSSLLLPPNIEYPSSILSFCVGYMLRCYFSLAGQRRKGAPFSWVYAVCVSLWVLVICHYWSSYWVQQK